MSNIAPHEGRELQMVVGGEKPLGSLPSVTYAEQYGRWL